jgi:membrane protein
MAIVRGLKQIYRKGNQKNWLFQRIRASIYALIFMILIIASLILMVFGNNIMNFTMKYIPQLTNVVVIFRGIFNSKHFLFPSIFTLFFTIAFSLVSRRGKKFYKEIPGAFFSALGWYLFTALYSLYVGHSPNFSYMYGSLATIIIALIWMYACMIIIFIGAEINYFINDEKIFKHYLGKKSE